MYSNSHTCGYIPLYHFYYYYINVWKLLLYCQIVRVFCFRKNSAHMHNINIRIVFYIILLLLYRHYYSKYRMLFIHCSLLIGDVVETLRVRSTKHTLKMKIQKTR